MVPEEQGSENLALLFRERYERALANLPPLSPEENQAFEAALERKRQLAQTARSSASIRLVRRPQQKPQPEE